MLFLSFTLPLFPAPPPPLPSSLCFQPAPAFIPSTHSLPLLLSAGSDGSVGVVQVEGDEGEELLLERLRVVVGDRVTCLAVSPRSTWGTLQVAFCAGPCALYWGSLDTSSEQGVLHLKDALRDSVALCRVFPALASPVLAMEIVADGDALSVACGLCKFFRAPAHALSLSLSLSLP